jgi:hypothetical protein
MNGFLVEAGWLGKYWEAQIILVRLLVQLGIKVDVKDRLPIFRLYTTIPNRCTGAKRQEILALLTYLNDLRKAGFEPKHKDGKYV